MEEYRFKSNNSASIRYGNFKKVVYEIHKTKYGIDSADQILKSSTSILKSSLLQINDTSKNNNSLIVGKVQSGKTSNLEMISALAFDNGFNLLVIYGGYDNTLLDQCIKRFNKVFNGEKDDDEVCILSTLNNDIDVLDDNYLEIKNEEKKPIILISLKRPGGLHTVNETLLKLNKNNIRAFVIDDEGDQASLNIANDKENEMSSTYAEIMTMKSLLNNPLYFSVTATPMANIFQSDISGLKPDSIHLVWPGNGYVGADKFHLIEDYIVDVPYKELDALDEGKFPKSLEKAINHFIISSAILFKQEVKKTNMIVHSHRTVIEHRIISNQINEYFKDRIYQFENGYQERTIFLSIKKTYDELFSEDVKTVFPFDSLKKEIEIIIKRAKSVVRNSNSQKDENKLKHYNNVIHVGGDLLQRGITFDNLTTTYFTRWSNNGNMDTSLQRARWFGYREPYLNYCKVFMPLKSKMEFSNLATIENDLWDQFQMIENGELMIEEVIVDADETSLKPTRKNVADIKKIAFTKKWFNQRKITLDINQIKKNNNLFNQLICDKELYSTCSGRTDGKESARYVCSNTREFVDFVKQTEFIFNQNPFNINDIEKVMCEYKKVNIVLMYTSPRKERERTFLDGTISALQQGADSLIKENIKYRGDALLIPDKDIPTVQVFMVIPIIDSDIREDLKQYMFSVHLPNKRVSYIRG